MKFYYGINELEILNYISNVYLCDVIITKFSNDHLKF